MDRYAVMGNPIAHSKSPVIHGEFAHQTGQTLSYDAQLVEPGRLQQAVIDFQRNGGRGLNITVPFKQDAFELATELTDRAQSAGAVNTLVLYDENHYLGDNTDGVGLVRDLGQNHDVHLNSRHILILGAGGAVRGILEPILQQMPARLVIANRTVSKAAALVRDFGHMENVSTCGFDELAGQSFDLVINGTSASLSGDLPPLPDGILAPQAVVYDMMYGAEPTPFMTWGRQQGAQLSLDGLGMLVEQAAESFYIWRKIRPDTQPVIKNLRRTLSEQEG